MELEVLLARFRLNAAEFKDVADNMIVAYLAIADSLINKNYQPDIRDEMVTYLAAHKMDLSLKRRGAGGQIVSVTEGSVSVQYAANKDIKSEYDMSSYGRQYKALLRSATITPLTRNCLGILTW